MGTSLFDSIIEKLKKYAEKYTNLGASWEERWAATDEEPFSTDEIKKYHELLREFNKFYYTRGKATQAEAWALGLQLDFLKAYYHAYIHRTCCKNSPFIQSGIQLPRFIGAEDKDPNVFSWLKKKVDELGGTE